MRARARVSPARARADRAALREVSALMGPPLSVTAAVEAARRLEAGPCPVLVEFGDAPAIPLSKAIQVMHGAAAREAATGQPQSDLEEFTGVAPEQQQREAEAGQISAARLRSIVERVERLEEERKALAADIKDIYSEAKSAGFEPKPLRRLIRERKREPAELEEEETLLELYKRALGM